MKVKVSEATGPVLDYLVAKADGKDGDCEVHGGNVWYGRVTSGFVVWCPSTTWSQGGPIIARERIMLIPEANGRLWTGCIGDTDADGYAIYAHTPLIAAMRCYVVSRLGEEVEIPESLL